MVGVHPDRVETFIRKSLNNLQLEYVDLYLVHFPVGCKYETGQVTPAFDDEGNILVEEKTDHEALWKVFFPKKNFFCLNYFIENGRTSP